MPVRMQEGLFCFGCGGLCRGEAHTSLPPRENPRSWVTYECGVDRPFRGCGLIIYQYEPDSSTLMEHFRVGMSDQFVQSVPVHMFTVGLSILELVQLTSSNALLRKLPYAGTFETINAGNRFRIELSGAVRDILVAGYYRVEESVDMRPW